VFKLIIEDDEGRRKVVPFLRDEITIGRQEGNTIRLTERNVSRQHARFVRHNGDVLLEDLGSYNGIRVNGQKIQEQTQIRVGDLVQIGDYGLAIEASAPALPEIPSDGGPEPAVRLLTESVDPPPLEFTDAPVAEVTQQSRAKRGRKKWLALAAVVGLAMWARVKWGPVDLKGAIERVTSLTQALADATVVVASEPAPAVPATGDSAQPMANSEPSAVDASPPGSKSGEREALMWPEQKRESEPAKVFRRHAANSVPPSERPKATSDHWPQSDRAIAKKFLEQGTTLLRNNQLREAEGSFSHCLDADPAYFHCYMFMGSTLAKLGRMDEAAKYYRMFVHMAPTDPLAPKIRGYIEGYETGKR
jgi:tetratricopeptide (TPR) repeat protein